MPLAPGTWGSLLACVIVYFCPSSTNPIIIAFLAAAGVAASERAREGQTDPGRVVIDEFVGMLIAVTGHSTAFWGLAKGFILFRAFDILKPYPVRKLERLPGGYGIVADDVLAGLLANAALFIIERLI